MKKDWPIYIDLDGTLAEKVKPYTKIGKPIEKMIEAVRNARIQGYEIRLFTSRSWPKEKKIRRWFNRHNLNVDQIICGKPKGYYIDDHGISPEQFIKEMT